MPKQETSNTIKGRIIGTIAATLNLVTEIPSDTSDTVLMSKLKGIEADLKNVHLQLNAELLAHYDRNTGDDADVSREALRTAAIERIVSEYRGQGEEKMQEVRALLSRWCAISISVD